MKLRWYQEASVQAAWDYIKSNPGNPCIELPTGAGKSLVIAQLMTDVVQWSGRALLLAHRKELLEQTAEKLEAMTDIPVGIYSAGLKRRDTDCPLTMAGIQSVYNKADQIKAVDIILVDEAHLIPKDGDGMFQTFLQDMRIINPRTRVIGLTATPYRLKEGLVCGPDHLLNDICFSVGVKELINEGFLCPLTSKETQAKADTDGVRVRGGEWVQGELAAHLADEDKVKMACEEIIRKTQNRHSTIIFCAGVEHAEMVKASLPSGTVEIVTGETPPDERASTLEAFKAGAIRYLVNVDVLTTGFDAPNVDCVVLLRPTMSPGLYYQMVGRGLRLHESKTDCLVLDFAGNVERHGPVDQMDIKPQDKGSGSGEPITKTCPECDELVHIGSRICPGCGHEWPAPEAKHDTKATEKSVLSSPPEPPAEYQVTETHYQIHTKRGADESAPKSMRVDYQCGLTMSHSEWICMEHEGFARRKAETWWGDRCDLPCPTTAEEAVTMGQMGLLAEPTRIWVDKSGEFNRITKHELGSIPPGDSPGLISPEVSSEPSNVSTTAANLLWEDDDDLPF